MNLPSLDRRPGILFVTSFSDPAPVGHNRTVVSQAEALAALGWNVEILTWPVETTWTGPRPGEEDGELAGCPYVFSVRSGLPYHVVALPNIWSERFMTDAEWDGAVRWGVRALEQLRPEVVHVQFWQNMWWILEAAQQCGIPTVYSAHDYGLACHRTVLVTGSGTLCDGVVSVDKCGECVVAGRGFVGKVNEKLAGVPFFEKLLHRAFGLEGTGPLARRSGVRMPVGKRVTLLMGRASRVLSRLDALIVTSDFAVKLFEQLGARSTIIHVMPWFHSQRDLLTEAAPRDGVLKLAFVTRVSPEKGLHVLLRALELLQTRAPVELHIAGDVSETYGHSLERRYASRAGHARVVWHGWIENAQLGSFYRDIDAVVVPSLAHETGPLTLIEALAHRRPVICTDMPTVRTVLKHGTNGLVFPFGDVQALARVIDRVADDEELLRRLTPNAASVWGQDMYAERLGGVYESILGKSAVRGGTQWNG